MPRRRNDRTLADAARLYIFTRIASGDANASAEAVADEDERFIAARIAFDAWEKMEKAERTLRDLVVQEAAKR